MIVGQEEVQRLIPQKAPFVMVSDLISFEESSLVSGLQIESTNIFVESNQFLEAGIIEHMAQSVALHTGYQYYLLQKEAPTGYLGSLKSIEIIQLPKTDDYLKTSVSILHEIMGVTLVDIEVRCNDVVVAKGQMKTVLAK